MEIDWNLIKPVDVAGNIQAGFQLGTQMVEKAKVKSALAAYAQAPGQATENALAAASPDFAMQLPQMRARAQQAEQAQQDRAAAQTQAAEERRRENIIKGAQLIRELKPTDQASWQQTKALAAQAGIDVSNVPDQFDPEYAHGLIKMADTFAPPKSAEMPGIAKEVDYYRSIGRDDLAQQLLERHAEGPPLMVENPDSTKTIYPRGAIGGAPSGLQPGAIVPDPRKAGGQTQPASGNFPR